MLFLNTFAGDYCGELVGFLFTPFCPDPLDLHNSLSQRKRGISQSLLRQTRCPGQPQRQGVQWFNLMIVEGNVGTSKICVPLPFFPQLIGGCATETFPKRTVNVKYEFCCLLTCWLTGMRHQTGSQQGCLNLLLFKDYTFFLLSMGFEPLSANIHVPSVPFSSRTLVKENTDMRPSGLSNSNQFLLLTLLIREAKTTMKVSG